MAGIFTARVWEAARVIEAGRGGLLLAEPETGRGAITPGACSSGWGGECARRARRWPGPRRHDRDVALLRLAPGAPSSLWELERAGRDLTGRSAGARYSPIGILGLRGRGRRASRQPLRRGGAGSCCRPRAGAGGPGCPSWRLLTGLSRPSATTSSCLRPAAYRHHSTPRSPAGRSSARGSRNWRRAPAQAALRRAAGRQSRPRRRHGHERPAHPLGPVGHLALVTGLASAEADTRVAAAQLWSDACADGRLDPVLAATALVTGVVGQALKLSRSRQPAARGERPSPPAASWRQPAPAPGPGRRGSGQLARADRAGRQARRHGWCA